MQRTIATLYVQTNGCYSNLPGVEPYDLHNDARLYPGPHPVIAHPPCKRWSKFWFGSPSSPKRFKLGDDDGCFESALAMVRKYGGVFKNPAYSKAWPHFGINKPPAHGGWIAADFFGGWTCHVEQGNYGHRARKATWLYAIGIDPPPLIWGPSAAQAKLCQGYHSSEEREQAKASGEHERQLTDWEFLSHRERAATPIPFRDLLLELARSVQM